MRTSLSRVATTIVAGLLAAACSSSPSPTSVSTPAASAPAATPAAAVSSGPSPSSVPTKTATPHPPSPSPVRSATHAWERLGTIKGATDVSGALVFRGAYLAYGGTPDGSRTWLSTDGRSWKASTLGLMVRACPASEAEPDAYPEAVATDGRHVVFVGIEHAMDVTPCGTMRAVSWATSDGRTWQRSHAFGDSGGSGNFSDAKAVWAVPGGWEALVWTGSDQPTTLWRSSDGLTWQEVDAVMRQAQGGEGPNTGLSGYAGTAGPDGTRVLAVSNDTDATVLGVGPGQGALLISTDGRVWQEVDASFTAARGGAVIAAIVPPAAGRSSSWLVVTQDFEHNAIGWITSDLRRWKSKAFPRPLIEGVALTRYGFLATGLDACSAGGPCSSKPRLYLSSEGLTWTRFQSSLDAVRFVDGPTGLLGFAKSEGILQVWRLKR
jgi:hypothetical protein